MVFELSEYCADLVVDGQILVVELSVSVVDTEAGAQNGLSVQRCRRPGDGDAGVNIKRVRWPKLAPAPQNPCGPQVAKSKGMALPFTSWKRLKKL